MKTPIHNAAAKGYQNSSDAYERGRPEYPAAAVERMFQELKIRSAATVVDLGAGTGKFTKLLAQTRCRIIAVEPVEAMRKKFSSLLPSIEILEGTAESIPLADQSVDAVVVAQAFHWFNGVAALDEIHRVLKPNGRLGLIWNVRDESVDWVSRLTDIIDPHEKGAPRYKTGSWKSAFESTPHFTSLQQSQFHHSHFGTPEMVLDRISSISFIAALTDPQRESVRKQVQDLVAFHPLTSAKETIEFPYRTDFFWCERKS